MSNPLGAILSGIGGGLTSAGDSLDERALLATQLKRQQAMDAIARAQKLQEMDLTPATDDGPFANAQALTPSTIPLQTGMSGGINTAPPPQSASDLAMKQLTYLPDEQGNIQAYQKLPFGQTKLGQLEARDEARQDAQERRQQALLAQTEAAKAIDPATMRRALDGDMDAVATVLSKHPELQTTFSKPAPPPKTLNPMPEYTTLDGKPVFAGPGGTMVDGTGSPLRPSQVQRYQAPKPPSAAQQGQQEQLGTLLNPLVSADRLLNQEPTPGVTQRFLTHVPGQPFVSDATQGQQNAANEWVLQYQQSLKSRGMPPATMEYLHQTYIPVPGDKESVRAMKAANRKLAAQQIAARAGAPDPYNVFSDIPTVRPQ